MNKRTSSKKRGNSLISAVCIVLLVLFAAGGLGYLSQGFRNWDTDSWFPAGEDKGNVVAVDGDGNAMTDKGEYPLPVSMMFSQTSYSVQELPTVQLNVLATPLIALRADLDWSVTWVNESAEWAQGKATADYITVSPHGLRNSSATVACVEAFGEQILITVSYAGSDVTASCVVDYEIRPVSGVLTLDEVAMFSGDLAADDYFYGDDVSASFEHEIIYSVGTVAPDFGRYTASLRVDDSTFLELADTPFEDFGYYIFEEDLNFSRQYDLDEFFEKIFSVFMDMDVGYDDAGYLFSFWEYETGFNFIPLDLYYIVTDNNTGTEVFTERYIFCYYNGVLESLTLDSVHITF
jgi:hypothetical protein